MAEVFAALVDWLAGGVGASGRLMTLRGDVPDAATAAAVAFLAGVSTLLGHGFVLTLNRVRGVRYLAALALGGMFLVTLYALQGLVLAVVGSLALRTRFAWADAAVVTLAGTAPLTLGFLVFIPTLGLGIGRVLQVWCLVCQWWLFAQATGAPLLTAALVVAVGWVVAQLASRLLGRPLGRLASAAWTAVTGRAVQFTPRDILAGTPFVPLESGVR